MTKKDIKTNKKNLEQEANLEEKDSVKSNHELNAESNESVQELKSAWVKETVIFFLVICLMFCAYTIGVLHSRIYISTGELSRFNPFFENSNTQEVDQDNNVVLDQAFGNQDTTQPADGVDPSDFDQSKLALFEGEHVRGSATPKYALIEYSDFDCPFCKEYHPNITQFVESRTDVVWAYRHFPLQEVHPYALLKAGAAECASKYGESGAFWEYTDRLYTLNQEPGDIILLAIIAEELGIAEEQFNACIDSDEVFDDVQTDFESGIALGVTGTPTTFVINLETGDFDSFSGAASVSEIEQAVLNIQD